MVRTTMRLSKLFKKTLLVFIVLFGIISIAISSVSAYVLYQRIMQEYANKALSISSSITRSGFEVLVNKNAAAIQSLIDHIVDIEGVSYALYITADSEIIAHTFAPEIPQVLREELPLIASYKGEEPIIHSVTFPDEGISFCITTPLLSGSEGYILIGISQGPIKEQISRTLIKMQGLTFLIFSVCVVAAYLIMDRISRPLTSLTNYAQKIAEGDFSAEVDIGTSDEIGVLAQSMKSMGSKLSNLVKNLEHNVAKATTELHNTLNHITIIFDNVAEGLVVTDQNGKIIRHNHQLVRMFGLPESSNIVGEEIRELLGITLKELAEEYGVEQQQASTAMVQEPFETVKSVSYGNFEYEAKRAEGTSFTVGLSISSIEVGSGRNNIAVVRDITRQKKAEEELKKTQDSLERKVFERTRDLSLANVNLTLEVAERGRAEKNLASEKELLSITLRSIVDGVITTDGLGRVVLMNKAAEKLTGFSQQEARLRSLNEVFITHDIVSKRVYLPLLALKHSDEINFPRREDLLLKTRDNRSIEISHSVSPLADQDNTVIGLIIVFRDITSERKIEEENIKAEKLTSLGILAGGIAHDFNNILTAILNNIGMSRVLGEQDSKMLPNLDQAEVATRRAQKLTTQLLTFSKGGEPIREITSFASIIEESVQFALRGTNVSRQIMIDTDLWDIDVDKGQISQVIDNLVINGVQAMPQGGKISVSAENYLVCDQKLIPLPDGPFIKCQVADGGCGIPKEQFESIFDPYFTTKESGSGLGLATSYSIIKNHGGFIEVDSEAGGGTTFSFYLPAIEGKRSANEKTGDNSLISGKGTVLIMDDEESVRSILGDTLDFLGYTSLFACDGVEALDIYRSNFEQNHRIDYVLMDLTIPGGMGGQDAIRELLKINPAAKVIVSSGYSNDPVMANYKDYGFSGVLVKPFSIEELSKKLHELVEEETTS